MVKKVIFKIKEPQLVIDFKNDYIKQRENSVNYNPIKVDINLSDDNKKCIIEISNLCKKYKIDYTFMIGPNINLIDKSSLFKFKEFFENNDIEMNTSIIIEYQKEIGDAIDHIKPILKYKSTGFYKSQFYNSK